jgi:hypothetical protein
MRAVVEKLPGRLGENEQVLRDALSQLQLAFVQLKERAESVAEAADDAGIDIDPAVEDPVTEDPVTDD